VTRDDSSAITQPDHASAVTEQGGLMADEPTAWELQRSQEQIRADVREGFKGLNARLDKLVSSETLGLVTHRVDERIDALTQALAEERAHRTTGDKELEDGLDKLVARVWFVAASIILPVVLFVATAIRGA